MTLLMRSDMSPEFINKHVLQWEYNNASQLIEQLHSVLHFPDKYSLVIVDSIAAVLSPVLGGRQQQGFAALCPKPIEAKVML